MNFNQLKRYIEKDMRMAHIYQPVMIKTIIEAEGRASATAIAKKLVIYDDSQIEYYEKIVKIMPARILKNHGIVRQVGRGYELSLDLDGLSRDQKRELMDLCDARLREYIEKRGKKIWQHRWVGDRAVSGSVRYEVLKNAGFRCQLCGVSAEERALEVDHIIPRNLKGADTMDNYQALCYKCNANKRDTDSTSFREWGDLYGKKEVGCFFCDPEEKRVLCQSELAYVLQDGFPVTKGHVLIIPKRHVASLFDLFDPEVKACMSLLKLQQKLIAENDRTVEGFNVGVNVNEAAGQSIFHCHWHLIPRRRGDVPNPRGGVRHIIPGKGDY
jgi:diadenosine tetraphosphate (Ap4A) HIT family hydrolase